MERHGRTPPSETEAWLAQELAFLYAVERRIQRRGALIRRTRWIVMAMLGAGICCSIWAMVGTHGRS
jgi:hypothetical protein